MSPTARDARTALDNIFNRNDSSDLEDSKNRLYACSIISLLPVKLEEHKPHLFPNVFIIPAAEKDDFTVTYVSEAHCFLPDPFDEKRNFKQVTPPHEMARSICEDYNTAHIGTDSESGPGLFFLIGRLERDEIISKHGKLLDYHRERQKRWFHNLIAIADADWEKNHNRMSVSDLQRIAARYMGINKSWVEIQQQENMTCKFCKALIAMDSVKCFNCKEVVNVEKYNELMADLPKE